MDPFYFKSYDRLIGVACDLESLVTEMKCLSDYDYDAVNYHILNGHISMWLNHMGFPELAQDVKTASSPKEAIKMIKSFKKVKRGMGSNVPDMGKNVTEHKERRKSKKG
jgi:hypothetical protein